MVLLRTPTVALLGNPNTGKTTLFNALAGMRQRVGNYPGVTVETKKGRMTWQDRTFEVIDLPGTYSLAPRSPDEMLAVNLILGQQEGESRPDVLLSIVDASNLERNLYLTTQAMELGVPVVVALNMIDLAHAQGITVDADRLGRQLGLPVVPIQANKGIGIDQLKEAIARTTVDQQGNGEAAADRLPAPRFPEPFEREAGRLHDHVGNVPMFLIRRLLLDVGGWTEKLLAERHDDLHADVEAARQRLDAEGCPVPAVEARARYSWIRQATEGCIQRPEIRPITLTDRLDRILTHRILGTAVFVVLMFLVFQSIFTWAAPLMDAINGGKDALAGLLRDLLPPGPLTSLLVDGMVMGVGAVVVFLPQIVILFGFIAVLEDCGYMARAAYLMDKIMARAGLSGKSFIPMLSSVACAVPGIMATRVIENRRDRLATILVAPLMSCSARLPVYILLIGAFLPVATDADPSGYPWWMPGLVVFAMYMIGIVVAPLVAWMLKGTLLRGETPVFVMEMPLYKIPSLRTIGRRMYDAALAFLRRAGTLILASMIIVWALLYFPGGPDYERQIADIRQGIAPQQEQLWDMENNGSADAMTIEALKESIGKAEEEINKLQSQWKGQSILGRMGHAIEPAVEPLGWDWRIGTAALASFPAREVVIGTMGIIYQQGDVDAGELRDKQWHEVGQTPLSEALKGATWESGPRAGQPVFSVPVALSLMVFFALCCQCVSTLAVIRRETKSWGWPIFTFVYMTVLAYLGALVVYQVGSRIAG